jgi:alanyl aminopeptidase
MTKRPSFSLAVLSFFFVAACASSDEKPAPVIAPAPPAEDVGPQEEVPPAFRLPDDVTPLRYTLDLVIIPEEDTFKGTVKIDVSLSKPRRAIWLHGARFEVDHASYTPKDGAEVKGTFATVDETGLAGLRLDGEVGPGEGTIHIDFRAEWDTSLKGLYKVTEEGNAYAFTQFEATSARYAFPCFDEPRFKTPYTISVTTTDGHTAIANTREIGREQQEPDLVKVRYADTEPFPTYLIAFAVGPLDVVDQGGIPPNDVRTTTLPFRGIAAKGRGDRLAYAMRETGAILTSLERYFGAPYPFDKLDIIAVPDFASGAMENAGAVTFREWLLLIDEKSAPANQKRAFSLVMAHELAHMWFGDVVTMPWWDDIWLNEAFATWMAYRTVDEVTPSYGTAIGLVERGQMAMNFDALVSARQIRQPVNSDHDIDNAFDAITYSKGGVVLGMFERLLGKEVFRDGIRRYMAKHRFGSATTDDLLASLSEASSRDVATPFKTFLEQPGVPVVDTALVCEGESAKVTFTQARYLPVGSKGDANKTWQIPICVRSGDALSSKETCTIVTTKTAELPLEGACPDFYWPNAAGVGYFKVRMSEEDLLRVLRGTTTGDKSAKAPKGKAIPKAPPLSSSERLAVADAVKSGFFTGTLDVPATLRLLPYLADDRERAVARVPFDILAFLHDEAVSDKERENVQLYIRSLYRPVLDRMGLVAKPGESTDERAHRAAIADLLARVSGDPDVNQKLAALGRAYAKAELGFAFDAAAVDPDLAPVALQAAVRTGDSAFFEGLLARLKTVTDAPTRTNIILALAASTRADHAVRYRALALDPDVRTNEIDQIVLTAFMARENRTSAWDDYKTKMARLIERAPDTRSANLFAIGALFCTTERAGEVRTTLTPFVEKAAGAPRILAGVTEGVELCAARVALHRDAAQLAFRIRPDVKK